MPSFLTSGQNHHYKIIFCCNISFSVILSLCRSVFELFCVSISCFICSSLSSPPPLSPLPSLNRKTFWQASHDYNIRLPIEHCFWQLCFSIMQFCHISYKQKVALLYIYIYIISKTNWKLCSLKCNSCFLHLSQVSLKDNLVSCETSGIWGFSW